MLTTHNRNKSLHYLRCRNNTALHTCKYGGNYAYERLESAILDALHEILADDEQAPDDASAKLTAALAETVEELRLAERGHKRLLALYAGADDDDPTLLGDISERKALIAGLKLKIGQLEKFRSLASMTTKDR